MKLKEFIHIVKDQVKIQMESDCLIMMSRSNQTIHFTITALYTISDYTITIVWSFTYRILRLLNEEFVRDEIRDAIKKFQLTHKKS